MIQADNRVRLENNKRYREEPSELNNHFSIPVARTKQQYHGASSTASFRQLCSDYSTRTSCATHRSRLVTGDDLDLLIEDGFACLLWRIVHLFILLFHGFSHLCSDMYRVAALGKDVIDLFQAEIARFRIEEVERGHEQ